MKTPQNALKVSPDFLIEAIEKNDPQLVNFIDSVFAIVDGATTDDPVKKLTPKQIQQAMFKLPILAMRSPIVLGLYSKFEQQITGTVTFPIPDTVVYVDDSEPNGDLPSCEFDQAADELEEYKERNHIGDPFVEEDNKATKDYEDGVAPFKSLKSKK